jgi:WD40 repeat protein
MYYLYIFYINLFTIKGALVNILRGHTAHVTAMHQLPNSYLVSGAYNSEIKIWNSLTGEIIKNLK